MELPYLENHPTDSKLNLTNTNFTTKRTLAEKKGEKFLVIYMTWRDREKGRCHQGPPMRLSIHIWFNRQAWHPSVGATIGILKDMEMELGVLYHDVSKPGGNGFFIFKILAPGVTEKWQNSKLKILQLGNEKRLRS